MLIVQRFLSQSGVVEISSPPHHFTKFGYGWLHLPLNC